MVALKTQMVRTKKNRTGVEAVSKVSKHSLTEKCHLAAHYIIRLSHFQTNIMYTGIEKTKESCKPDPLPLNSQKKKNTSQLTHALKNLSLKVCLLFRWSKPTSAKFKFFKTKREHRARESRINLLSSMDQIFCKGILLPRMPSGMGGFGDNSADVETTQGTSRRAGTLSGSQLLA